MEDNDYVMAFDHFYTTNHIQILKSLLPFIDDKNMPMLPVLIKYMELKYTISVIGSGQKPLSGDIHACSSQPEKDKKNFNENIENIYKAIRRYLSPDEDKNFSQLLSTMRTMNSMREMQQMIELVQSLNPEADPSSFMENFNPSNMNFNGLDINDIMQIFGGGANNNGDK